MPVRRQPDPARVRAACARLLEVGPRGWALLAEAQLCLVWASWVVRRRPRGTLLDELATESPDGVAVRDQPDERHRVAEIGLAVDRVARVGLIRPLCLVRSLALQRLLVRRGVEGARIRVGVRMRGSAFDAHAWVEWNGVPVAEESDVATHFDPFSEVRVDAASLAWSRRARAS